MTESRQYLDDKGCTVFVSEGLNGMMFGAFRKGPYALHRVKSPKLPMVSCRKVAERNLELYARHTKGWMRIPTVEETRDILLLVRSYEVPLERISTWSDLERAQVCAWAGAMHLRASDNIVRVPDKPALIAILDHLNGRNG